MEKIADLKSQWETFKTENPKVRIRDAAQQLNTTEAELLATAINDTVTRLTDNFPDILKGVESLGHVMALTRNDHCVHERKGVYQNLSFMGAMGLAVNPDIDLRLFMSQWKSAFAVNEQGRKSLQFFGKDGAAVHKIYLTEQSNVAEYDALVGAFRTDNQSAALDIAPGPDTAPEKADSEIDVAGFQEFWLNLKDTHAFHGMLRQFGVSRKQGLRLAPAGHAVEITVDSLKAIMTEASETNMEIMIFVGNAGCIQIHTGLIQKLLETGPWFNVLDPEFNLHLRMDGIASVWLVKKPTEDGVVTSIEVFDADGDIIIQLFGKRKPGIPENEQWRMIANELAVIV